MERSRIGAHGSATVALVTLATLTAFAHGQQMFHRGVNLGICDEPKTARARIEGLDICVWNRGDSEGQGVVFAELLDSTGTVLLRVDPAVGHGEVRVPPYQLGGKEGTLVRINPTRSFLAVTGEFERTATRYAVRATIETSGRDTDPSDNAKVKEFNTPSNLTSGGSRQLRFAFRNDGALAREVRWVMHRFSSPVDWRIEGALNESATVVLLPGEELRRGLTLQPPPRLPHGSFAEIRLGLIDASSQKVLQEREWFLPYDTVPPFIANMRAILLADHSVAVQALVGDEHSGLYEQRAIVLQHSSDGGHTWTTEMHRNRVGHYIEPTVFEFITGPFARGAKVLIRLEARDRAGNTVSRMPEDASLFVAPANAERLAVRERSLSQPERSRLFAVERLQRMKAALNTHQNAFNAIGQTDSRAIGTGGGPADRLARRRLLTRRIEHLQKEIHELRTFGIDVAAFKRLETTGVRATGRGWATLSISVP